MSQLPDPEGLGRQLHAARFLPLPDADQQGELIGTRMWRLRDGYVEYLALGRNGLAHAVRARAVFDYHSPADHGPLVGHRFGIARNALDWLLYTHHEANPGTSSSQPDGATTATVRGSRHHFEHGM